MNKQQKLIVKGLSLPAGTTWNTERDGASWRKDGGMTGDKTVRRVCAKALAMGFVETTSGSGGTPDGSRVGYDGRLVHSDGIELEYIVSLGVTKARNWYRLRVKVLPRTE